MSKATYRLVGAINPRGKAPAICVPAFSSAQSNSTYVQHIGIDDIVLCLDQFEPSDWEPVKSLPKTASLEPGDPAIHCILWSDEFGGSVINTIDVVRSEILKHRWIIDLIENPFERLDFAQISGQYAWFSEEAEKCESSFSEDYELTSWLKETLLLSRIHFAVDSVLVARSAPATVRRRIMGRLVADAPKALISHIKSLFADRPELGVEDAELTLIENFFAKDVAYKYAVRRLFHSEPKPKDSLSSPARWYKKLTASDAQRKPSGNQRGSIPLVKAGFRIDPQTYFKNELFGSTDWITGKTRTGRPLETATVRFRTMVLGRDLGVLSFTLTYAAYRQANQFNYTSLFHLGPLANLFRTTDMSQKWLSLERDSEGHYSLIISDSPPQ